ncbi:MAG: enoyl-CoA hydratase/isomerase family protein [Chloroflexi bacterium]|nr:enoyl-CoA hydratase/isomerase family protein [Chloroflexota bacterium]
MSQDELILEKKDAVAIVTFNRPRQMNAISDEMNRIIFPKILKEVNEDKAVRAVIITGTGDSFCAGADVGQLGQAALDGKLQDILEPGGVPIGGDWVLPLYNLGKPVIAAVNGVAAGGGVSVALLCDIRIASEKAAFNMAFVRRGLIPDCGCSYLLPRLIGSARSFEYLYAGAVVSAKEAAQVGLVNRVVPHEKLMEEAMSLAGKIAKGPPLTLAQLKKALHYSIHNNPEQQLYFETYAQKFLFATEDFKEGMLAFYEKREPDFKGK